MGRGIRSTKRNTSRVMVRDSGPQRVLRHEPSRCWEFTLIGNTGVTTRAGAQVIGAIIGTRVVVSSRDEALGFAPNNVALRLIEAVRATQMKLRGEVLSGGNGKSAPTVKLCLSR